MQTSYALMHASNPCTQIAHPMHGALMLRNSHDVPFMFRYVHSTANNVSYWPLDYPPLSGYQVRNRAGAPASYFLTSYLLPPSSYWWSVVPMQSWLHGQILLRYEPEAVELIKSHGYETASSKRIMRLVVLLSDILSRSFMGGSEEGTWIAGMSTADTGEVRTDG